MLKVTFDSNIWEKLAAPERYPNDPDRAVIAAIRQAACSGELEGYICASCVTQEAIMKRDRHRYFSECTSRIEFLDLPTERGVLGGRITITGDDSKHPGLGLALGDRLRRAISELGFRLLPVPRLAIAKPMDLPQTWFAKSRYDDLWEYNERFAEAADLIEASGRGFAVATKLAARIEARIGTRPDFVWRDYLKFADATEAQQIMGAISEWADGDVVSSHVAYGNDILCTHDRGKSAGLSVFDAVGRNALTAQFNTRFMGLRELAAAL